MPTGPLIHSCSRYDDVPESRQQNYVSMDDVAEGKNGYTSLTKPAVVPNDPTTPVNNYVNKPAASPKPVVVSKPVNNHMYPVINANYEEPPESPVNFENNRFGHRKSEPVNHFLSQPTRNPSLPE